MGRYRGMSRGMSRCKKTSSFKESSLIHRLAFEWIDFWRTCFWPWAFGQKLWLSYFNSVLFCCELSLLCSNGQDGSRMLQFATVTTDLLCLYADYSPSYLNCLAPQAFEFMTLTFQKHSTFCKGLHSCHNQGHSRNTNLTMSSHVETQTSQTICAT